MTSLFHVTFIKYFGGRFEECPKFPIFRGLPRLAVILKERGGGIRPSIIAILHRSGVFPIPYNHVHMYIRGSLDS